LFTAISPVLPHIKAGKVQLLGVASAVRTPQAPEVPTFAELGVKDMQLVPSVAALVPAGTPPAIVARLAAELRKAVLHPEAVKRFEGLGIDPVGSTPEQYAVQLAADIATFSQAVKLSGAKVE
jgi:tripartite-type tricarboxylate transporter receptor subunit TctC